MRAKTPIEKRITTEADESSTVFINFTNVLALCLDPLQCGEINYMYNWRNVDVALKNLMYVILKH